MIPVREAIRIVCEQTRVLAFEEVAVDVARELGGGAVVEIDRATEPGQFISRRATEVKQGETVLRAGTLLNAACLAALASFGCARVRVGGRARVAVVATGPGLGP